MCSILGFVSFDKKLFDKDIFIKSSNIMTHRGPDNSQYLSDSNFQFAFNRLSILDLSFNGNQPMTSICGRYVCMLNGEIYNFKKIYEKIKNSFIWKGASDTEVLLNAWIYWGASCLKLIDGMFSFSILDKKLNKIIIARDRVGEKPLYYLKKKNSILFSSRPAPIINLNPALKKDYNHEAVSFYLESGYFPRKQSVYSSIKKLEPGNYIEFCEKNFSINEYWSINNFNIKKNKKKSLDTYVNECESLLQNSIEERLSSDRPLGFFLSGGVDSSLVIALASKVINKKKINAFNLGFNDKNYDESEDAEFAAKTIGVRLEKKILTPTDLLKLIPNLYQKFDEPFFDSSCFPMIILSDFAKTTKVDVAITGDGGDELFGGYENYRLFKILLKLGKKKTILNFFFNLINKIKCLSHRMKLLNYVLTLNCPIEIFSYIRSIKKDFDDVLISNLNQTKFLKNEFFASYSKMSKNNNDFIDNAMRFDILHTLNDDYLQKTDLSSMSCSLECRTPYLSKDLIEWSLSVPSEYKVTYFDKKIILKKLAEKYYPKNFIYKKKKGFEIPLKEWLRGDLFQWSKEIIFEKKNYHNLPLDQKKVKKIFNLHNSGKRDCHPYLWSILMLLEFNKKTS